MSKALMVTDEVLVRRARAGDGAAFVKFATRWWPVVGRVAWSMLGNVAQAVTVTEEAIRIVLESPQEPEPPITCCMYRLVVWLAILRRRSNLCAALAPASPMFDALDRLNSVDRAALLLRDVEQLSVPEVAAVLECEAAEVRARVHRARLLVARSLEAELAAVA